MKNTQAIITLRVPSDVKKALKLKSKQTGISMTGACTVFALAWAAGRVTIYEGNIIQKSQAPRLDVQAQVANFEELSIIKEASEAAEAASGYVPEAKKHPIFGTQTEDEYFATYPCTASTEEFLDLVNSTEGPWRKQHPGQDWEAERERSLADYMKKKKLYDAWKRRQV